MRRAHAKIPLGCASAITLAMLAGCSGGSLSQAQAAATTVATVDSGALKGAALQRWLLKDDSLPGPAVANTLVSTWINTALVIDALRKGRPLEDSATVDSVIRPDAERGVVLQFLNARDQARPAITAAQADSVANIGRVRVFQQIVVRLPPRVDSQAAGPLRSRIAALVRRARDGEDFSAMAKQTSDDSATRANGGFLPAITQGQLQSLPPRLRVIWNLEPGQISDPLLGGIGVHIMRRATREQARPMLQAWLAPVLAHRADSVFIDSLARAHHVTIAADARPRVRALAREPVTAIDTEALATWQGGRLTPAMVRSATLMLDARARTGLSNASDSLITEYLHSLAVQELLLSAAGNPALPTAEARKLMAPTYHQVFGLLRQELSQLPTTLSPADAATMFIDSMVAGKRRYIPLPGALAEVIRTGAQVKVDTSAVGAVYHAAIPAWQAAHANDSAKVAAPAPPAAGLVPGGQPPR